jgi:hypothetical protein
MTKTMLTRKEFLGAATGGTILLLLQGCGGGGDSNSNPAPSPPAAMTCGASGSAIAGNHGHSLSIPVADLDSPTDKTYSIQGSAGHDHQITLTVAQLQALKTHQQVMVTSTTVSAHNHVVTSSCT